MYGKGLSKRRSRCDARSAVLKAIKPQADAVALRWRGVHLSCARPGAQSGQRAIAVRGSARRRRGCGACRRELRVGGGEKGWPTGQGAERQVRP
ncbi:hypothetical protein SAMN05216551_101572 [Chitinasiproducens palmae]|uniref:Uncharacterized protein n=1 Tax=Chitinasiproducens palmae TaxID=1770053 RepID=A0A1H2PJZ4_9BURK|nr:hypothetical protein SAMN05216551_101572 [Chitinasiproducens palmae]